MEKKEGNFLIDYSEKTVQDVISKLQFISQVKNGEKLDLYSLQIVSADSWVTSAYRTFLSRGESRVNSLEFARTVINQAFGLAFTYLEKNSDYNTNIGEIIIKSIIDSKKGLKCMGETYKLDRLYVSEIQALILILDGKIEDIKRTFLDLHI